MTTDPFTAAARALGADPAEVRESMRNATEHAERNGMPDEEFVLWIWHAGAVWARGMEAARAAQEPTDAERSVRSVHEESAAINNAGWTTCLHCTAQTKRPVLYPCETIRALDSARAARRDEDQR